MQAEIQDPIPPPSIDWWETMLTQFVTANTKQDSIWIATHIQPPAETKSYIALTDPKGEYMGYLLDATNPKHVERLREYHPLPKGFRLTLTQD